MKFGYLAAMWILVGVYCYAGLTHLQAGLRRPIRRLHVQFGAIALLAGFAAFSSIELAAASTPADYIHAAKESSFVVCALFMVMPWFVRDYVLDARRWPALIVSGAYFVVLVGNLLLPYSMMLSGYPDIGSAALPWGESIARATVAPHPWLQSLWVAHVLTIGFFVMAIVHAFRERSRASAWGLAVSVTPFLIALILNVLMGLGIIERIVFVGSFGFMAMVLAMSVVLSEGLRRASKQMQTVLDNVPAAVYLKLADGRYSFVNRHFERLHGISASQILGKRDHDVFAASTAEDRAHADNDVLRTRSVSEHEETLHSYQNATSSTATYNSIRFPLMRSDGRVYAVCGISTDITERKAATDALRELAATLERRVSRRTEELAQLNRELEAFVYSVSHDLRAPLTAVNGFADLLLREQGNKLDQTAHRYLTRIRDGAMRMAGLIQDLLGLSRVTQQSLERRSFDLAPMADAIIKTLHETDPQRNVDVEITRPLFVNADAKLLNVALNNLLANAWKYTSKKTTARIEVGVLEQGSERAYFVRDNGAGFNPEHMNRLFRPFVRLHAESEFPGTGIGLATVSRIVTRHGGRVWAEGKLGEGATFYFTLPPAEEDSASA